MVTSKSFEEVLASIYAAISQPNMAEFFSSIQRTASVREMEDTIHKTIGPAGLMLFSQFDHGGIINKGAESGVRRVVRLLIGNPSALKVKPPS